MLSSSTDSDFPWENFLELASELNANSVLKSDIQAICRTCIGRAYYSAFGCARAFKRKTDRSFRMAELSKSVSLHDLVICSFNVKGDEMQIGIYRRLNDLRKERNNADYESRLQFNSSDAQKAIRKSSEAIQSIAKLASQS